MQNSKLSRLGRQSFLVGLLILAGCSSADFQADTVDYKSAGEKKTNPLVYPPDLTAPVVGSRYSVPAEGATLSQYNKDAAKQQGNVNQPAAVLPTPQGMKIERVGTDRWLVVSNKTPTELYPKVKDFWEQSGFLLLTDSPKTGMMETDWAENRAKIPQDIIRRTLG